MARWFGNGAPRFSKAAAVTPSDSTDLTGCRGVYVGGAGNVAVRMVNGGTVTFTAVPVGTTLDVAVDRVMSTNTTATLLIALY